MKKQRVICLLCAVCLLTACVRKNDELKLFFAWTQGYLASPLDEENTIALTLYQNTLNPAFDFSSLQTVQLDGISKQDISLEYVLTPIDVDSREEYQPYALTLTYTPHRIGMYTTETVTFTLKDQTQFTCPIGKLVFEIGNADSCTIDTWLSPVASSNSTEFPYQYSLYDSSSKLLEIKFGESEVFSIAEGVPLTGKISLVESYSAPLVIIHSMLRIDQGGKVVTSYGKGCYCGSINVGNSVFEESLAHWSA